MSKKEISNNLMLEMADKTKQQRIIIYEDFKNELTQLGIPKTEIRETIKQQYYNYDLNKKYTNENFNHIIDYFMCFIYIPDGYMFHDLIQTLYAKANNYKKGGLFQCL